MIRILWQCDCAVAVDKPAGLSTTSPPGTESLESRLRIQLDRASGFLSAVHRLDRDVGGVVLIALTKKAARLLSEQFESRKVKKTYHAWVHGRVDASRSGERWEDWVRKIEGQARGEICAAESSGAKRAETLVEVIRYDQVSDCTLIKLSPVTGRMHQLRLQTSARGHAILGDAVYGSSSFRSPSDGSWKSSSSGGIALVAVQIQFRHPRTGVPIDVKSVEHASCG